MGNKPKLPASLVCRENKNGTFRFYYQHPMVKGKRGKLESLGDDIVQAKRKWADLEDTAIEIQEGTLSYAYGKYIAWAKKPKLSHLSPRTIEDRENYWKDIEPAYGHFLMDNFRRSKMFLDYFEAHSSQCTAKKQLKFLSQLFDWSKARDYMSVPNPLNGVIKQFKVKENREMYVRDYDYNLVHHFGDQLIKDVIDFSYMCANRPAETYESKITNIENNVLKIQLPKTRKRGVRFKRIPLVGKIAELIERIKTRTITSQYIFCDQYGQQLKATGKIRNSFDVARKAAKKYAEENDIEFITFQLRDLRAKAATDTALKDGIEAARKLLGHTTQKQTATYIRPILGESANALDAPDVEKLLIILDEATDVIQEEDTAENQSLRT